MLSMNSTNETVLFDRFLSMYNLCVFTCIIVMFVFHCTHVRISYVSNSYFLTYLLTYLLITRSSQWVLPIKRWRHSLLVLDSARQHTSISRFHVGQPTNSELLNESPSWSRYLNCLL